MKAKDLRGKNMSDARANALEDIDAEEPKQEEDAVAAAYENISKRLESIRSGKVTEDDSEDADGKEEQSKEEPELEEWKGPKPPAKAEEPEEEEKEHDLRKVDLKNLEDEDSVKEDDDDQDEEDEEDSKPASKKEWEPEDGDPLDEEEDKEEPEESEEETAVEKEDVEAEDEEKPIRKEISPDEEEADLGGPVREEDSEEPESLHSEVRSRRDISEPADLPEDADQSSRRGPDTLDDLTDENAMQRRPAAEEEDDYSIPSLKGSGQRPGDMGYNATSSRESFGQSYSPRGNMDGNDPNNFFSQHQPQPAKRANKFHLLILVVIGVAVIGFTVYVLKGGFGDIQIGGTQPSPSPSATATPEPTPTPTPEPEVDRGAFTVKVLNGTSTSGLAGKVRDKVKELGYKTATPGNAADSDVAQTEIRVKEGTESAALFERLKLDLAPDYDAIKGEDLDDKAAHDAEVIIGAK